MTEAPKTPNPNFARLGSTIREIKEIIGKKTAEINEVGIDRANKTFHALRLLPNEVSISNIQLSLDTKLEVINIHGQLEITENPSQKSAFSLTYFRELTKRGIGIKTDTVQVWTDVQVISPNPNESPKEKRMRDLWQKSRNKLSFFANKERKNNFEPQDLQILKLLGSLAKHYLIKT